jgi:acyl-CoA synthetase (AMP-forming)/AMP-acid ligase II
MTVLDDAMRRWASVRPDALALDPVTAPGLAFGELARQVDALAARLGAADPDRQPIALALDHGVDEVVHELAALAAAIPVLSLPAFFTAAQRDHAIHQCGARAPFMPPTGGDPDGRRTAPSPLPSGTARITFTSGSTGTPKGVCLSADHLMAVAQAVVEAVGARHAGRHLALLPPGILLETVAGLFATLLAGGAYVCPPQALVGLADPFRPDFATMLDLIAAQRITSLILVPEYLAGLVAAMEASGRRLPDLTIVAVGGARTPPALLARARALGLPVRQGYGLTECGSVVALEGAVALGDGSVGQPLNHVVVRIATDGEVLLDGPLCLGAIGEPPPTRPFATGDLGRIDGEGRLWIEGRKSSLIVTSFGRNVAPEWVEEALTAQDAIAQAMVHGDGLPRPCALLVPAQPGADLDAAVAAANASLPGYAQIGHWQEVAHFTPLNHMLTGNGRLRRREIAAVWLDGEPDFFVTLEAQTVRERLAFLSIPQVRAGLTGAIDRAAYLAYLAQAWHHVRHTVPLMQAARARLVDRPELVALLDDYIAEESGHDEWILSDIAMAGGGAEAVRHGAPAPATKAMVDHAYERIANDNPVGLLGMVYVLESVSVALASRGAAAVAERLGLPPAAFTYLTSHGALDQDHLAFFASAVNALDREADRAAITQMAKAMFGLFGAMFAGISLGALDVAA